MMSIARVRPTPGNRIRPAGVAVFGSMRSAAIGSTRQAAACIAAAPYTTIMTAAAPIAAANFCRHNVCCRTEQDIEFLVLRKKQPQITRIFMLKVKCQMFSFRLPVSSYQLFLLAAGGWMLAAFFPSDF
jgi:hypothetical protein